MQMGQILVGPMIANLHQTGVTCKRIGATCLYFVATTKQLVTEFLPELFMMGKRSEVSNRRK